MNKQKKKQMNKPVTDGGNIKKVEKIALLLIYFKDNISQQLNAVHVKNLI